MIGKVLAEMRDGKRQAAAGEDRDEHADDKNKLR